MTKTNVRNFVNMTKTYLRKKKRTHRKTRKYAYKILKDPNLTEEQRKVISELFDQVDKEIGFIQTLIRSK